MLPRRAHEALQLKGGVKSSHGSFLQGQDPNIHNLVPVERRFSLHFSYLHLLFSPFILWAFKYFSATISINFELQIHLHNYASHMKPLLHEETIFKSSFF